MPHWYFLPSDRKSNDLRAQTSAEVYACETTLLPGGNFLDFETHFRKKWL
jgi:predicted secreted acid phosphatase